MMKKVRMDLKHLGITNLDGWDCNEYKVTLKYGNKQLTTPFYTGRGWESEPSVDDVLPSLLFDAGSVNQGENFEDWAESLGYDADSRRAENVYKQCLKTSVKLRSFLGDDYDSFLLKYEDY